ncbi:MAG: leucine-rich repeat protein [Clostridia bacterium]|nr:leucine-rich repeat protein [Clostridia bacterium]
MLKLKRWIALGLALVATLLLLCACSPKDGEENEESTVYYTVTFDANGGSAVESRKVAEGTKVSEPTAPTYEGYVFDCWKRDGQEWLFDYDTVKSDMTLTASWIKAESLFGYAVGENQTAIITELKQRTRTIVVPTQIAGYPVVGIGESVFENLPTVEEMEGSSDGVGEIVLPETVTTVGKNAFRDSDGITITVQGALTDIGEGAFYNCDGLGKITLGEGLQKIAYEAFSGCLGLKNVQLPQSVALIEENAFEGCAELVSVMLYGTVGAVENSAFDDCDKLVLLYFIGAEEQLDTLLDENTADLNDAFLEGNWYLYAEQKPAAETGYKGYWYRDDKGNIRIWQ